MICAPPDTPIAQQTRAQSRRSIAEGPGFTIGLVGSHREVSAQDFPGGLVACPLGTRQLVVGVGREHPAGRCNRPGQVQFHPGHGEWITILRASGFAIDSLREIFDPALEQQDLELTPPIRAHVTADTRCRHCGNRAASTDYPLASLDAAIIALPRHRPGRQRTSRRTAAERRTKCPISG